MAAQSQEVASGDRASEPATTTFLQALSRRDFAALETSLAPAARARFLLPPGPEEHNSAQSIRRRIEEWFGTATHFEMLASGDDPIGERRLITWRLRMVFDPSQHEVVEQVAFVDVGADGIEQIDLLCSGFQAEVVFDAGDRGCADGLAQEFRRRMDVLPAGASLVTLVRDPAAKQDLPPLARMLGHSVTSVGSGPSGSIRIVVEKAK
ncbi:MAG: sulfurtransferase TusA family protein [Candidatus Dormibacteria bacterium]